MWQKNGYTSETIEHYKYKQQWIKVKIVTKNKDC